MKKVLNILILAMMIVACIAVKITVEAGDTTVVLNKNKTELERGDTFIVTLNVSCEDGINGLEGKLNYDEEKLELVGTEIVDTTKWFNLGEGMTFNIIHYASGTITTADIIKATFKVKNTAEIGTTAKVRMENIKVDSDASSNSLVNIGTKEVEVSIIERLNININTYTEEEEGTAKYISKITPKTTIQEMTEKVSTNGIIEVYRGDTKITDTEAKLATGMELRISLNGESVKYTIVITGDTDGDGDAGFNDILQINKHRLGKIELTNANLKAGDITGDGKADFSDILQINKYRLGKITSL